MPITESELAGLRDGNVVSASGDKIGSIGQIYLDDQTGEPTFVTANTGLFGLKQSFVPLQGARVEGEDLVVDYDKETVKDAPRIDDDAPLAPPARPAPPPTRAIPARWAATPVPRPVLTTTPVPRPVLTTTRAPRLVM
jgi:hypothetical protein